MFVFPVVRLMKSRGLPDRVLEATRGEGGCLNALLRTGQSINLCGVLFVHLTPTAVLVRQPGQTVLRRVVFSPPANIPPQFCVERRRNPLLSYPCEEACLGSGLGYVDGQSDACRALPRMLGSFVSRQTIRLDGSVPIWTLWFATRERSSTCDTRSARISIGE